ncbi:MAG TPA: extracellular solute-binding protein [Acidimicrobiales bacterium]|nr:extracellular solute-binding protein [Acidimicrobiales bacterium]
MLRPASSAPGQYRQFEDRGAGAASSATRRDRATTLRRTAGAVTLLLGAATLGCSGDADGITTLTWYINPDNGGQAALAETCTKAADGKYRITTAPLPNDADGQREQLVRRLAANDSSIDLMSLDVAFLAEFAHAGFLEPFDEDTATELTDGVLPAPAKSATWDDKLMAAPFWANTQLLWYRKSVAEKAGLDPDSGPVTWDQVIAAGEQTGTTVEVSAAQYEGYVVWINALVAGAGGEILSDVEAGRDATPEIDSDAGRTAAGIIGQLGRSSVADPQIDTATEETVRSGFQADDGGFMVNWPYVYGAAQGAVADGSLDQAVFDDIAWARYPQSVAGTDSAPPLGGIHLGVGAFGSHKDLAVDAVRCLTSDDSQTAYMLAEGNPAARGDVYDDADVQAKFPMAPLIRDSIASAGIRPQTPFYPDVSAALQRTFSPPRNVRASTTPRRAAQLITDVLNDEALV